MLRSFLQQIKYQIFRCVIVKEFLRTFYPFFNWECKSNGVKLNHQIFYPFLFSFSFEKARFLIGSAKVIAN